MIMSRYRLVAKCLDFVFRDATPPHGLAHLADDAEVIAGTIKSHNDLGMFGGHRERPCAEMSVRASCPPARANLLRAVESLRAPQANSHNTVKDCRPAH
jgi:hypothetical protein